MTPAFLSQKISSIWHTNRDRLNEKSWQRQRRDRMRGMSHCDGKESTLFAAENRVSVTPPFATVLYTQADPCMCCGKRGAPFHRCEDKQASYYSDSQLFSSFRTLNITITIRLYYFCTLNDCKSFDTQKSFWSSSAARIPHLHIA